MLGIFKQRVTWLSLKTVANFIKLNLVVFEFGETHVKKFQTLCGFQICVFFIGISGC
jgi:hypothetical protein